MHVLIVGASVAGVAVADGLRARGFDGRITLVDADPNLPYDKPPLSKQALKSDWHDERALLRPADHYRDHEIELVLGRRAVSLDGPNRSVALDDGRRIAADAIVLAPGVSARRLPERSMLPGVLSVRTLADSTRIRAALVDRPRLVVAGGGFIGAEAAAVAAGAGCDVTVVELLDQPFSHLFGAEVGASLARRHREHGVRLECGVGVDRVEGKGSVEQVVLTDGRVLAADLVLLGLGAQPATGWLEGSGLTLDAGGIVCDEFGRTSAPGIYAAGDAASWWDPRAGRHTRIEHWTTAKEHGAAVAHNILDADEPTKRAGSVPYFWSDQYGGRLQFLGSSQGFDRWHVVHGRLEDDEYVVLYGRAGVLIGALGLAAARRLMPFRALIDQGADFATVVAGASSAALEVAS